MSVKQICIWPFPPRGLYPCRNPPTTSSRRFDLWPPPFIGRTAASSLTWTAGCPTLSASAWPSPASPCPPSTSSSRMGSWGNGAGGPLPLWTSRRCRKTSPHKILQAVFFLLVFSPVSSRTLTILHLADMETPSAPPPVCQWSVWEPIPFLPAPSVIPGVDSSVILWSGAINTF